MEIQKKLGEIREIIKYVDEKNIDDLVVTLRGIDNMIHEISK